MELRNTITVAKNIIIFVECKPQKTVVLSVEVADGMVEATLNKWKSDSTRFTSICV